VHAGRARDWVASAGPGHGARVLILTTFDHDAFVYEALLAGASGFVSEDSDPVLRTGRGTPDVRR